MKNFVRYVGFAFLISLVPPQFSCASPGADNPMGPTGEYNGSITTGGSYDPYTGNAKRFVDDLTVTGSLGTYPLKWTRILNTRNPSPWSHSYQWGLWVKPYEPYHYYPNLYEGPGATVTYPDGRTLNFAIAEQPYTYFQDPSISEPQDRLLHMGGGNFDLLMRDGGRVQFTHPAGSTSGSDLVATAVIDPYGLVTVLTRDSSGGLTQIKEPGGRYIQINYTNGVRTSVQAFSALGQLTETVSYVYTSNNLTQVNYDDGTHASYTYGASNVGEITGLLIRTCDDVRFAGPMKQIEYEYMPSGGPYQVAFGQVKKEKNFTSHQILSEVTYPPNPGVPIPDSYFQRTETRGDGKTRLFQYSNDGHGELKWYTDFKGQTTQITSPATETPWLTYRTSVTDARVNTTSTDRDWMFNSITKIIYPPTDGVNPTVEFIYSDANKPYYMAGRKDENGNWTYYDRDVTNADPNKRGRLLKIRYPDQSTEEFSYNGFNQILTHKLQSGGTQTNVYDEGLPARGLKTSSYPPATLSDPDPWNHPTRYYYYSSGPNTDRLQRVQDPRGNSTSYEYNQRGQVTKVTHQDGTYTQSGYNDDGTVAWTADENHPGAATDVNQRTRFAYDEYKRVLTVTNPLGETARNDYGLDWADPLRHTTSNPKFTVSPMQKIVIYDYDPNYRKIDEVVALSTADEAWTFFDYDEVGNLTWVRDPRWTVTTFGYDARNRKSWMNDPIASDRNSSGHTMNWEYDSVGNKKKEIRADGAFRSWGYDTMNRLWHAYDWRTNDPPTGQQTTSYDRNTTGTIQTTTDTKGAVVCTFYFDALNRKTSVSYPPDATGVARYEAWSYDFAGNLNRHDNPATQVQIFVYDNRNRQTESYWSNYVGQHIFTSYDPASRVTNITTTRNDVFETSVAFGYDAANRQVSEEQTLAGYPTRRLDTPRDADGNRLLLNVPGYFGVRYDYTQRNQLAHIYGLNWEPWFNYSYDSAGNMVKRQDVCGGVNDSLNVPGQWYDPLNRPVMSENTQAGDVPYARSWQQYDSVGRMTATWRDEQGGKGERFYYATTNQLTNVRYNADQVSTGNPLNWDRWVDYGYQPGMLNRWYLNDNGNFSWVSAGNLNQYTNIGASTLEYDAQFNLLRYNGYQFNHDAQNLLTSATGNGATVTLTYDGLGRCVRRVVNGATTSTTLIAYDGWKPTVEWDGAGNFKAWNLYGAGADEILWRYQVGFDHLRYHHDIHGNVTSVLAYAGNILEKYTYDAFGKPTILSADNTQRSTSAVGNRFLFQGREYLQELGIYDYRHRMYHPGIGRFLQTDPIGFAAGDTNLFRYCGDDPVDRSDPTGLVDKNYVGDSYPFDFELGRALDATNPAEVISAGAHAGPTEIMNRNWDHKPNAAGRGMELPVERVVQDIKGLDKFKNNSKMPIRLYMCRAGDWREAARLQKLCPAQKIANQTDRHVQATGAMINPARLGFDGEKWASKTCSDLSWYDFAPGAETPTAIPDPTGYRRGGLGSSGGMGDGSPSDIRRTYGPYDSTTQAAGIWEASWGPGGWIGADRLYNR